MQKTESECVDCGFPCKGRQCPNYMVTRYYCDKCGEEAVLYDYEGEELCQYCLLGAVPKVEGCTYDW